MKDLCLYYFQEGVHHLGFIKEKKDKNHLKIKNINGGLLIVHHKDFVLSPIKICEFLIEDNVLWSGTNPKKWKHYKDWKNNKGEFKNAKLKYSKKWEKYNGS